MILGPYSRDVWNTLKKLKHSIDTLSKTKASPKRLKVDQSKFNYFKTKAA